MNNNKWKGTAELAGVAAIVASLIFVGFQMQQDRKIAFAEIGLSSAADRTEQSIELSQHAELWVKANNGESLSDADIFILNRSLYAMTNSLRLQGAVRKDLGQKGRVSPQLLAIFLYENPGARKLWTLQSENEMRYFSKLGGGSEIFQSFHKDVLAALAILDLLDQ